MKRVNVYALDVAPNYSEKLNDLIEENNINMTDTDVMICKKDKLSAILIVNNDNKNASHIHNHIMKYIDDYSLSVIGIIE